MRVTLIGDASSSDPLSFQPQPEVRGSGRQRNRILPLVRAVDIPRTCKGRPGYKRELARGFALKQAHLTFETYKPGETLSDANQSVWWKHCRTGPSRAQGKVLVFRELSSVKITR